MSVRAASVLALGELFGASTLAPSLSESTHSTTHAPSPLNNGSQIQRGFLGTPSMPSLSTSSVGTNILPPGISRPHPPPFPPSSSIAVNPFGVSAAALSAHGQNQGQAFRPQSDGLDNAPPPPESGAFGAINYNPSLASSSLKDSSLSGLSSSQSIFQGRRVALLSGEQMELLEAELLLATQLLKSCTDGSVLVRREAVIAISKFVILPHHISCIKLVASGLLLEAIGVATYDKVRSGVSTAVTGSTLQMLGKGMQGVSGDPREKELMTPDSSSSSASGPVSARSIPSTLSAPTISNVTSKLSDETQSQSKKISSSDPWHLSLSQSEIIVDRLAQYLQCVGYPATSDKSPNHLFNSTSIFSKLSENATTASAASVEIKQPVPKLPSQMPSSNSSNSLLRDTASDKKSIPPVPPIGRVTAVAVAIVTAAIVIVIVTKCLQLMLVCIVFALCCCTNSFCYCRLLAYHPAFFRLSNIISKNTILIFSAI